MPASLFFVKKTTSRTQYFTSNDKVCVSNSYYNILIVSHNVFLGRIFDTVRYPHGV